jgi:hypothetical protein
MTRIKVGDTIQVGSKVGKVVSVEGRGQVLLVAWRNSPNSYVTHKSVKVVKAGVTTM